MNDRRFDLLVVLIGITLVGWGAYEIYYPLAKVAVGGILISLVCISRIGS